MKNRCLFLISLILLITSMAFGEEGHDGFHEGHNMMPSIIVIFLVVVLAIAGILLYKRFPSKTSGNKAEELNELSIKVLTERYAKGEISKKEFNSISHELELTEDESIEITKFRLAKGEISMKEYDEIVYTIGKRH